ncbi:MAG TPA: DUF6114 domain-containing protein [Pseudonocardia sp.]|jgi:hypothetical protein
MTQPSEASAEQPLPRTHSGPLGALLDWSGERPWLGGLLTVLGGLTIIFLPTAGFAVVLLPGLAGISGFIIGGMIIASGLFLLFSPQLHAFIGVAAVLLSLASFVSTNLGGLVIGMMLGIIGGSLGFAWTAGDD